MRQLKLQNLWLLIGWLLLAAIVYLSLAPAPPEPDFEINDKVLHFAMYFVLTAWFAQIFLPGKRLVIYALSFFALGVVLEFGQGLSDERSTSLLDALANGTGIVAGLLLALTPLALTLECFERIALGQNS
ncbi:MAG: VanZ family protein [Gammaproteobacteria bacterium]|nr:VanZ family protein [Gammaproteobacteria bacterium]